MIKQSAVLASVVAGAAISTTEAGFLPGMRLAVFIASPSGAMVATVVVETSEDGTTGWATATGATAVTVPGLNVQNITLKQFIRLNMTAWTSGNSQMTVLGFAD